MLTTHWTHGLAVLGLGGLLIAGCAAGLFFSQDAVAEAQQTGASLTNPTTSTTQTGQGAKLTPEQEATLEEVRKILREAREVAEALGIENPDSKEEKFLVHNKRMVLSGIEGGQARAGDIEGARLTNAANGVKESQAIAIGLAKSGQPLEALKAVDTRNIRPQTLQIIVETLHKSGDGHTALDVIENVRIPWDRAEALFLYARFLARTGDPAANAIAQRAYALSNTLAKDQPWVYVRLAEFQADAGDSTASHQSFQKARGAALAAPDVQQLKSLIMVAKSQAQNGDQSGSEKTFAEAIRIAKDLPVKQREPELAEIARKQLSVGNSIAAAETVRLILQVPPGPSPSAQADGLMRQARWHLTLGDREAAKAALQTVAPQIRTIADSFTTTKLEKDDIYYNSPELGKSTVYSSLAQLAAECGLYEMAQESVRTITSDQTKANAIQHIITRLIPESERPEMHLFIQTLAEDATSLTGLLSFPRDLTLLHVSVIQAAAGDVKVAVRTADRVTEVLRDNAYREMVGILIQKKDWAGAQDVLSRMKAGWMLNESSHHVFLALANAQTKAGVEKQVIEWSHKQSDSVARANVLLGVAEGLMERLGIEPLFPVVRP
jgi:hypothetical protein